MSKATKLTGKAARAWVLAHKEEGFLPWWDVYSTIHGSTLRTFVREGFLRPTTNGLGLEMYSVHMTTADARSSGETHESHLVEIER